MAFVALMSMALMLCMSRPRQAQADILVWKLIVPAASNTEVDDRAIPELPEEQSEFSDDTNGNWPCRSSCKGIPDGDYQSCFGCNVYASCSGGYLYDNRSCAYNKPPLEWDDILKRCVYSSSTCHAGPIISLSYTIRSSVFPTFNLTQSLSTVRKPFKSIMDDSAARDYRFRYTTLDIPPFGAVVQCVNNACIDPYKQNFWVLIRRGTSRWNPDCTISISISNYIPIGGERLVLSLESYSVIQRFRLCRLSDEI